MTTKEQLQRLPNPQRDKAIKNTMKCILNTTGCESVRNAIKDSFNWEDNFEGLEYWEEFYKTL